MSSIPAIPFERDINLVYRRDRRAERYSPYSRSGRASLSERNKVYRVTEENILSNSVFAWLTNVLSFIGLDSLFGTNVGTVVSEDNQTDANVAEAENEPVTSNVGNGLRPQPLKMSMRERLGLPGRRGNLLFARIITYVRSCMRHQDETRAREETDAMHPQLTRMEPTQPADPAQPSQFRDAASSIASANSTPSISSSSPAQPPVAEQDAPVAEQDASVAEQDASVAEQDAPATKQDAPAAEQDASASPASPTVFSDKNEFLEWVKKGADARQSMDEHVYLTIEAFVETLSKERPFEPIKLRIQPKKSLIQRAIRPLPTRRSTSGQSAPSDSNLSAPANNPSAEAPSDPPPTPQPSYVSGFSNSTPSSLPPITNGVRRVQKQRMLKSNPYQSWRWTGLGSVRPEAQQGVKRSAPSDIEVPDIVKRRRLYEEERAAIAAGRAPEPAPRMSAPPKKSTVPHKPSPLRNVVNGSPPETPSKRASEGVRASAKMTPSAAFLVDVLEKTAAEKAAAEQASAEKAASRRLNHPDVANPYEEEAIVRPKIKPMEKLNMTARRERTKAMMKERESKRMKEIEKNNLTAREVIEATLPKGAKRSQPPPSTGKRKAAATASPGPSKSFMGERAQQETSLPNVPKKKRRTVTIEDASEEEEEEARNRRFPINPTSIIEEMEPEEIPAPARPAPTEGSSSFPSAEPRATTASPSVATFARKTPGDVPCTYSPTGNIWAIPSARAPEKATHGATRSQPPSTMASPIEVPKVTLLKAAEIMPSQVPTSKVSSSEASGSSFAKKIPSRAPPSGITSKEPTSKTSGPFLQIGSTFGQSSQPKTSSKLRTSFVPDDERRSESPEVVSPSPTPVVTTTTGTSTLFEDVQEKMEAWEIALGLPREDLPTYSYRTPAVPLVSDHFDAARLAAKQLPVTSLPEFDFSEARSFVKRVAPPTGPEPISTPFDFIAAGFKPKAVDADSWQCSVCALRNPSSAVSKCTVCDSPRSGAVSVAANIGKADEARQASKGKAKETTTLKPDIKSFDFAAAGMQAETPADQWLCGTCSLLIPVSAKEKCNICGAPRPAAPVPASEETEKANEAIVIDVDSTNGMDDDTSSPDSTAVPPVSASAAVVEPRTATPTAATTRTPDATPVPDTVPTAARSRAPSANGFDYAAAGLKPEAPLSEGEWKCSTCLLVNPASADQKCTICETPRPRPKKSKKGERATSTNKAKGSNKENQTGSSASGRSEGSGTRRSARLRGA